MAVRNRVSTPKTREQLLESFLVKVPPAARSLFLRKAVLELISTAGLAATGALSKALSTYRERE